MDQQTPLAVTTSFPWEVTFPPDPALDEVMLLTADVVTVGSLDEGLFLLLSDLLHPAKKTEAARQRMR